MQDDRAKRTNNKGVRKFDLRGTHRSLSNEESGVQTPEDTYSSVNVEFTLASTAKSEACSLWVFLKGCCCYYYYNTILLQDLVQQTGEPSKRTSPEHSTLFWGTRGKEKVRRARRRKRYIFGININSSVVDNINFAWGITWGLELWMHHFAIQTRVTDLNRNVSHVWHDGKPSPLTASKMVSDKARLGSEKRHAHQSPLSTYIAHTQIHPDLYKTLTSVLWQEQTEGQAVGNVWRSACDWRPTSWHPLNYSTKCTN